MKKKTTKLVFIHLFIIGIGGALLALWNYLDIGCVLRSLTGLPCPTCGATRAMFSLMKFDIGGYFYYHPMALPIVLALLLTVHMLVLPPKSRKYIVVYIVVVIIATMILYIYRLFNGLIP